MCDNAFYDYSDLTLVGGFAANYFVYLAMSKQLRYVNYTRQVEYVFEKVIGDPAFKTNFTSVVVAFVKFKHGPIRDVNN
jgi:hypothetical protein